MSYLITSKEPPSNFLADFTSRWRRLANFQNQWSFVIAFAQHTANSTERSQALRSGMHAVVLTPDHQLLAAEARIGPQHDAIMGRRARI